MEPFLARKQGIPVYLAVVEFSEGGALPIINHLLALNRLSVVMQVANSIRAEVLRGTWNEGVPS